MEPHHHHHPGHAHPPATVSPSILRLSALEQSAKRADACRVVIGDIRHQFPALLPDFECAARFLHAESVFLPAGVSGSFTVTVTAANINSDGVPNEAPSLDQDFALVIYNGSEAAAPVIAPGAATLSAESCAPTNNAVDNGETVTMNFTLSNVGSSNTANVVATLLASNGVASPSGAQSYGALLAGGASISRAFTFTSKSDAV